jgi:hypothetical protein
MSEVDPTGTDWTDAEIDLIVADYFDMLALDLSGRSYVKAHRNAALHEMTGRTRGSIERKHQNISAVCVKLGMPWIVGYKPLSNYQKALLDGIDRFLEKRYEPLPLEAERVNAVSDTVHLFLEPPPQLAAPSTLEPPALARLIRKFDPAERDARNRALGQLGEERVLHFERSRLLDAGRGDLAKKVRWVSQEDGDGAGYDILSYSQKGTERLLEVKTTTGHQTTPFYLTETERVVSGERPEAYRLVRLYDFARSPKAFELIPPLETSVILRPVNYRASFNT